VRNGIDIAHYAPWPGDAAAAERRRWIGDSSALLLGSNAGTALYKGWMDLVEALALLPEPLREQVHVLVAGKPPASAQQQRIAELGLGNRVHFPGLLADVRPAIAAIDVGFVLSYDVETISFACREMMAMGKPVLLSNYAGLPENIEVGREGWLVPVQDPRAVADALQRILEQRSALPAMGAAARERAVAEFGLDLFVERTEAVYRRLLQD
jgi:glycosyltransferase involved in cell wall biosynthesis